MNAPALLLRIGCMNKGIVLLRLEDERAANKIDTIRRLLENYADQLMDNFVVVTETRVRFARTSSDDGSD